VVSETPIPESITLDLLGAYPKRLNLGLPIVAEIVISFEMGLMVVALTKGVLERIRERMKIDINRKECFFVFMIL